MPGIVVADHADEDAARAEARDVARHIAGAADDDVLAALTAITGAGASGEMRDDLAIDEVVEHQIADAEHRLLAELRQSFFEIEHATQRYRSAVSRNCVT